MRRTPLGYANEEQKHLEKLLKAYVIEPSCSQWASPSVLLQDCIDTLEGCRYFTTLDMASGYYLLEVAEEDIDKTAFVTKYGLFSFRIMPSGLCKPPATFSRSVSFPWY